MKSINPAGAAGRERSEQDSRWHSGMRQILFRLLDPLVAGRSIRTAVEAGWGDAALARALQSRYDWRVFPLTRTEPEALSFQDAQFDAVFAPDIAGKEDPALNELARMLAPKGLLVLRASALDLTRERLIALVESHGIRVLRATYINTLPAPAAPAKSGWLDALLYAPLALESYWLAAGLNLPIGRTILLIGEKQE